MNMTNIPNDEEMILEEDPHIERVRRDIRMLSPGDLIFYKEIEENLTREGVITHVYPDYLVLKLKQGYSTAINMGQLYGRDIELIGVTFVERG